MAATTVQCSDHKAFYDKLQHDVVKASGKASTPDPDSALAQVAVSKRRSAIASDLFEPTGRVPVQQAGDQRLIRQTLRSARF